MHSVFRARFWAAAEIGLMFGGERCIWMAEVKFPNVPCKIILNKFKFNIKLPLYLNWEIPLKPLHKWKIPPPSSPCLFLYAAASSVVLLWCCCPSSVYRDHYVSTKADERETHRDHKRRQASLSDPLITRWFLHQHGFWTPLKHARNMKTEDDRQAHTRMSYTSIQIKSHPRAWSIILDLGNNVCVRIMTTQKVHSVYLCSTSMQIHPFPVNDNFFENSFPNFLTTCFKKKN